MPRSRHRHQPYQYGPPGAAVLAMPEVLKRIGNLTKQMRTFWRQAAGWAPKEAAAMLSAARLDWQVELARTLRMWVRKAKPGEEQAALILGWSNLGSLVEGALKILLSVYLLDYLKDEHARKGKKGVKQPDGLTLEDLRQFFVARGLLPEWHVFIDRVQQRRNAVHAFRDRALGTRDEFRADVRNYLEFLRDVNCHLPYPDGGPLPGEHDDLAEMLPKPVDEF